jgi:2-amino-4-hydroxy-6-hydroxymethyldihydropteridine diphosphokinase
VAAVSQTEIVLALGSNKPHEGMEPGEILRAATESLSKRIDALKASSVYLTKPMYVDDQSDFCNMAVAGQWTGSPFALLDFAHEVEAAFGRDRSLEVRNGPRSLDVDIILFGNQCIDSPELTVPHPKMTERAFVLMPLLEIMPKAADPRDGRKYAAYLSILTNSTPDAAPR